MRLVRTLCAAVAGCSLLSFDAIADGLYGGIEMARERLRFAPEYTVNGTPDGRYVNRATGTAGSLFAGHRRNLSSAWSLAFEARLTASDTRWRLHIPDEPASLRYDIPYSASLTVQPTFHASERVSLFVEGGLALARIRERKSGSPLSNYDKHDWRPGLAVGAGVNLRLGEAWSARVGYRQARYRELSYASRDAGGNVVERIRDKPEQSAWYVGVLRSF
ncbi:MAG: outer membrane beta-barrel protein [Zoogloeaceae bacterium]|nr:outer membrane beta-barrel protein [Zoogloeaceae bacterium]